MKRAWICIAVVAACGDTKKPPQSAGSSAAPAVVAPAAPVETPRVRSPLADSFALLPRAIVSAEPNKLEWIGQRMMSEMNPLMQPKCWAEIQPKLDGYYRVEVANRPDQAVFHSYVIHGTATLDEVRRCRLPDKHRKESKNPKLVIAADSGFFPFVFADLGNGWLLMIEGELHPILASAAAISGEPPTTDNALANAVGMKAEPGWKAIGQDITSEVLGVPSIGARSDFIPTEPLKPLTDPVTITVYFDSPDAAKLALTSMGTPKDNLFDDTPKQVLELAKQHGEVRVDGSTVVYRGMVPEELAKWEGMFTQRGKPVVKR